MIDAELVRRLVAAQFPQWTMLPVVPVLPGGWDNRTFRLGDSLSVRLPSADAYAEQVAKEQQWLPILAPQLPLPIPVPVGLGEPSGHFPLPWSVYEWIEGDVARDARSRDPLELAVDLAEFLVRLRAIDPMGGPTPGPHNFHRGGSLHVYDDDTRSAIRLLGDSIDAAAATAVWDAALQSEWDGPPVWFHGDVSLGNLLLTEGRLSAVIDFGLSGIGDPACDLAIAFSGFDERSRLAYSAAVELDASTWARGRGWSIWKALIDAVGAANSPSPERESERAHRVIDAVIADHLAFRQP